jgi:cullin-associated NEDD8-dissociated protein 1
LQCIGEIGRRTDLASHGDIEQVILVAFDSPAEEIKSAASHALGKLAVGNIGRFLPVILDRISSNSQSQYLLVGSLREMITRSSSSPEGIAHLHPVLPQLLPILFTHCESSDEGTRNVVAECLGKLALVQPQALMPELKARIDAPNVEARATVITALKFAIVDHPHPIDEHLKDVMATCLHRLKVEELKAGLGVRHACLLTLNYATHNKPILVRDYLKNVLPDVYAECKPHADLVRIIIIGPFKHKVDDGIETRKAAFECLYTLLETCQDCLDVFELITNALNDGLKDEHDVKLLAHLILSRLASCSPLVLLQSMHHTLSLSQSLSLSLCVCTCVCLYFVV